MLAHLDVQAGFDHIERSVICLMLKDENEHASPAGVLDGSLGRIDPEVFKEER